MGGHSASCAKLSCVPNKARLGVPRQAGAGAQREGDDMADGALRDRLMPAHPHDDHALQARLAAWNRKRFALQTPAADWQAALDADHAMRREEITFIETTRAAQSARAASAPRDPAAFVAWFEALK